MLLTFQYKYANIYCISLILRRNQYSLIGMLNKFAVSTKVIAGDKHVVKTFNFLVKNLKRNKASLVMLSLHATKYLHF